MSMQTETKPVSFRLSAEDKAVLRAAAAKEQRSVTGQLRWMIAQLANDEAPATVRRPGA